MSLKSHNNESKLYKNLCIFMKISRRILLIMINILDTSCRENQNLFFLRSCFLKCMFFKRYDYYYCYYYWYSALGPVWAETRAQSGDWYGSGTLHLGQVLRGSLPLLSPAFLDVPTIHHQVPPRPPRRERSQRRKWELCCPVILPK